MARQIFNWTVFLTLTIAFTSCNGQVKKDSPKDGSISNKDEPKTITGGQPKKSRGLLQDKAGNFWLCNSENEGVTVYNGKTFTHYTEKDGLSSNFVFTILEDNSGKLWFGTADGITCYDGKVFSIIPITAITGNKNYSKTMPDPNYGFPKPEENWVQSIMQDRTGMFWFGTMSGVYRYDGKTFTHFSHNDNVTNNTGIIIGNIESILEDNNGNIWFGGRGTEGVFLYDGKTLANFKPNGENWAHPILQDKTGIIWFSSRTAGLYRYDGKTFSFFGKGEFSDFFFSMEEDSAGNFWFGNGKKSGVTFYNGKDFINYTDKDGLCDVFKREIIKDKDGNIWFNCAKNGLCRYDGKIFTNFSE
jgi:ligand-binding sensor domain-containing protein